MNRQLSVLLAGPSLFALATTALAQPAAPPAAPKAIDEATQAQEANQAAQAKGDEEAIIVTARRRAESLLDVPQTVQAVTGKDLQTYNILKFEDISQLVPGLNLQASVGGIFVGSSVRGTTFSQTVQGSPTVETYINEIPVSVTLMFQNQFDVGQIEVLKGPQGTQRGRSAPSGAMTLTTRRPDLNEVGGSISMTGTNRGGINIQAALGVPIIQNVLAIRVAGLIDENEESGVKSGITHQEPSVRSRSIRATLRFEPTDSLSAVLMYQHIQRKGKTWGGILFGTGATGVNTPAATGFLTDDLSIPNLAPPLGTLNQPCNPLTNINCAVLPGGTPRIFAAPGFNGPVLTADDYMSLNDFPNLITQKYDLVTAQIDWRFAGQKLSYVGGYARLKQDDSGGGGDASNTIVGRQAAPISLPTSWGPEKRQTNELRLASDERVFGMFDYTVGGYYGTQKNNTVSSTSTIWAGAFGSPLGASAVGIGGVTAPGLLQPTTYDSRYGFDSFRHGQAKLIEKAAFANVLGHFFNDKLELEAGGRKIWLSATKQQSTEFLGDAPETLHGGAPGRALLAVRNPNGLGACPATLTGTNTSGVNFFGAQVVGSTYPGTCDVQMTIGNGINLSAGDSPRATRKFDAFVYRLAASYHVTPDIMGYVSYGTAWRAGPGPITGAVPNCAAQFTVGFPDPHACDQYNFLDPDKSKSIELGIKGAFFNRKLSTTVAIYKQKFSGFFVFGTGFAMQGICTYPHLLPNPAIGFAGTVQPGGCNVNANALTVFNAPVKTKGIDADFNFRLNEDFNFGGAVSWSEGKFGDANIPCSDRTFDGIPDGQNPVGFTATQFLNGFPGAPGSQVPDRAYAVQLCNTTLFPALKPDSNPKWNFNLHGEISHEVFTGGRAFIRALFNYTPKNKNLNPNPAVAFHPDDYGILNLFAGLRGKDGSWDITFAARNVLNNRTILSRGLTLQSLTRPPGTSGQQLSFTGPIVDPDTGLNVNNSSGYRTISFVSRREFQLSARFAFGSR